MEKLDLHRFSKHFDTLIDSGIGFGTRLLIAIVILTVGLWLTNKLTASLRKIMKAKDVEPSLASFLSSLSNICLKLLVVVIVLTTVGIEMTSIVAILGAASLAIGMALSGTLQNFAGGVVILLFKPFKVGDFIETEKGFSGTVLEILIFTTRLKTPDNRIVYLPNGTLANGVITNFNQEGIRRVDCTFNIGYGNDFAKARTILLDMLAKDARVHKDPAPQIFLTKLGDSSLNILVRFWANSEHIAFVQFELNEKVYTDFTKQGLDFPNPQMDVRIKQ